ncbi:hypothetical protein EYF80_037829 [Liparis tanakae]|uniref:Uncharacterized protein n=1 Tax=Liparis tanakae TaxID=230148 RepID=A0A4Z2GF16_9TELE|nr:hypothetical protein EYF80_037829 [Liparis tanakae]
MTAPNEPREEDKRRGLEIWRAAEGRRTGGREREREIEGDTWQGQRGDGRGEINATAGGRRQRRTEDGRREGRIEEETESLPLYLALPFTAGLILAHDTLTSLK